MIAKSLMYLSEMKVVANELICVELSIEYLLFNLSSFDLLFGH